jgi:hypothetical protein
MSLLLLFAVLLIGAIVTGSYQELFSIWTLAVTLSGFWMLGTGMLGFSASRSGDKQGFRLLLLLFAILVSIAARAVFVVYNPPGAFSKALVLYMHVLGLVVVDLGALISTVSLLRHSRQSLGSNKASLPV